MLINQLETSDGFTRFAFVLFDVQADVFRLLGTRDFQHKPSKANVGNATVMALQRAAQHGFNVTFITTDHDGNTGVRNQQLNQVDEPTIRGFANLFEQNRFANQHMPLD